MDELNNKIDNLNLNDAAEADTDPPMQDNANNKPIVEPSLIGNRIYCKFGNLWEFDISGSEPTVNLANIILQLKEHLSKDTINKTETNYT